MDAPKFLSESLAELYKAIYEKGVLEAMARDNVFYTTLADIPKPDPFRELVNDIRRAHGLPAPPKSGTYGAIERSREPMFHARIATEAEFRTDNPRKLGVITAIS